jgi:hypothetical protein
MCFTVLLRCRDMHAGSGVMGMRLVRPVRSAVSDIAQALSVKSGAV